MLLRILSRYTRPYRLVIATILTLQLVGTLAALMLPSINADIIDNGVVRGDTGYIVTQGGWMLAVSLLQIACTIGAVFLGARTAMGFGRDLRSAVFRRVGMFSGREVARFGAPSLLTRSTNDVQQVQMMLMLAFTLLATAPIMMVGGIIMALREDLGLAWLVAVAVPVLGGLVAIVISRMVPGFRRMQKRIDRINEVLREQIGGIRVIRAFVRERHERARFGRANAELTDVTLYVGRWMALMFPLVMLVTNVSSVAVLWFGGLRVASGAMEIGSMTAFLSYLMQILIAVMMSTFMLVILPRAAVSADRIGETLDTEPTVLPPAHGVVLAPERGHLQLRGVGFRYPGANQPVLTGVDLDAAPGQTVAVIGSTGAGKSTLLNLIPRLFDPTEGAVLIDGIDVRTFEPEALWARIGLVPQRAYLFSGTVASNLRFGKPDATEEEMWRALDIAQAKDFVAAMDGGLEAPIAQGGTNVSGGQRQRLAIARALVREPEVYLFDDAFSSLDLATDARLRSALAPVTRNATVVIVAQRVATIVDADQIVVLEDGRVVGRGTHTELLAASETYGEIVASQRQVAA
ncbi:MAG TPA: ABC transporter ATP-binding protein [Trueperaceae bacterium]|nr:ABC transporter ATP-binding protein [Trueperaceae bacterium]